MKLSNNLLTAIVVAFLLLNISCGDPVEPLNPITVTSPNSSSVWQHYNTGILIEWTGGNTDDVTITLMQDNIIIDTLTSSQANTHSFVLPSYITPSWGDGDNYQVKITDDYGESGLCEFFTIEAVAGEEVFSVTNPTSGSIWYWQSTGTPISWNTEYSKGEANGGKVSSNLNALFSDDVHLELWKGTVKVTDLSNSIPNSGSFVYDDSISFYWIADTDYSLRVFDANGNYGISDQFEISDANFSIEVIEPDSETEWLWGEIGTVVQWKGSPGEQVILELWKSGNYIIDFSNWTENDGYYSRNEPIPEEWAVGSDYNIRVVDSAGHDGFSQNFFVGLHEVFTDEFTHWSYSKWDGNWWNCNIDNGFWKPDYIDGVAQMQIYDTSWGEIRTEDSFSRNTRIDYTIIPYLESGATYPDCAYLGLSTNWVEYGSNTAAGFRLENGQVHVWYETYSGGSLSVATIGSYTVGEPITLKMLWNDNGSLTLFNGSSSYTLSSSYFSTSSAEIICVVQASTDGFDIDRIVAYEL